MLLNSKVNLNPSVLLAFWGLLSLPSYIYPSLSRPFSHMWSFEGEWGFLINTSTTKKNIATETGPDRVNTIKQVQVVYYLSRNGHLGTQNTARILKLNKFSRHGRRNFYNLVSKNVSFFIMIVDKSRTRWTRVVPELWPPPPAVKFCCRVGDPHTSSRSYLEEEKEPRV